MDNIKVDAMSHYKQILVALDLTDESAQVLDKADALCSPDTKISIIHVIEPLTFAYGGDIPVDLTEIQMQLQQQAEKTLRKMVGQRPHLNITESDQHIIVGQPSSEIHHLAKTQGCDLILVGSHGRKGLALLLGSTANAVLHGASCDVLAVRISAEER